MTDIEVKLNAWTMNYVQVLAVQGESQGRTIIATLIDRTGQTDGTFNAESVDRPIDLTGVTARLYCIKPDGTVTFSDGTIMDATNGIASFVLPYQATTAAGEVACQILLTKSDNSTVKAIGLALNVQASDLEDAAESTNEFSALVTALNEIAQSVTDAQQAVSDANTAIAGANTARDNANSAATAANTAAGIANTSASNADAKAALADTATTNANTATTNANAAISAAETATTNANAAADRANTAAENAEGVIAGQLDPAIDARIAAKTGIAGGIADYDDTHAHIANADIHVTADQKAGWTAKANSSILVPATLTASGWTGTDAPYSQTISVAAVTGTSANEILPAADITAEQLDALQAANIQDGGQAAGSLTLLAYGDKPGIDLPVRIIVRGDL